MTNPYNTPLPPSVCMGVADVGIPTHCESGDHYHSNLIQFDERWRLIVCAQNHQWILQRREGLHGGAWRGIKYFRTKNALLKMCEGLGLLSSDNKSLIEETLSINFGNKGE